MKLITFNDSDGTHIGCLDDSGLRVSALKQLSPHGDASLLALIQRVSGAMEDLDSLVDTSSERAIDEVTLLAPIPIPLRNIFCVGKNYHDHAREFHQSGFDASAGKEAIPEYPIIFTKASTTVIGPNVPILSGLDFTHSVDYEGELCVVIGTGGRGLKRADAFDHVFGYTIVNDVTSRTLQSRHKQWFVGKNLDTFCPMGPWIVTRDEVPNPTKLRLQTHVNGELRQDASVSQLIFDIPSLIETLSATMTLLPGDLIATGTCAGVGIGFTPPKFLCAGDVVSISIDGLGTLTNHVA